MFDHMDGHVQTNQTQISNLNQVIMSIGATLNPTSQKIEALFPWFTLF